MKKSELKSYIKEEIKDILDEATIETSPEDLSKVKPQAGKDDTIKVVEEENIGLADLEEMGYEAGEQAFEMASNSMNFKNNPDFKAYRTGFFQGFTDQAGAYGLNEEENLNEMAKIAGDLKSAIEKVISDNPDLETLPLKKAIKADDAVKSALGNDSLYDNQLSKFISSAKGEREIGQRGRKADPNTIKRPKSPTGKVGRPAKSQDKKDKESKTVASKLNKSVTTVKGEEPTAKDIKQAIGFEKQSKSDLQAQEKRKMVKAFIADMKKEGIISANGKVEDKEKYDAAWAKARPEIDAAVKNIK
jgi:hypothetical protein